MHINHGMEVRFRNSLQQTITANSTVPLMQPSKT